MPGFGARGTPLAGRLFDAAVAGSGAGVALVAVLGAVLAPVPLAPVLLLAVPLIGLMAAFPLSMGRAARGVEVGFDSCVLVFLAAVTEPVHALALWCVGVAGSQAVRRKRLASRVFNAFLGAVAGALALATMLLVGGLGTGSPREFLAIAAGAAVYFVADYTLSAVSVALEAGRGLLAELRQPRLLLAMAVFVAIDSLGYLAALVYRDLPGWAILLLVVPMLTILVATTALSRGREHARRLAALFDAAAELQTLTSRAAVREAVARHAARVLASAELVRRSEPPRPGEVGAQVHDADQPGWLVGPARARGRSSHRDDQQALDALAAVAEEAYARLRLVEQMGQLARRDTLTGLGNRSLFLDRVEHAVAVARRSGRLVAVCFLDLDGFKAVNDQFGHEAGDALLRVVAARLGTALREGDTVARLGGDEFAVLVEDVTDAGQVAAVCRRLLAAVRPAIDVAGHEVAVDGSIGVALSSTGDEPSELLRNADMAMYHAKALGKGRYVVYDPELRAASLRRLELVESLRDDVRAGRLVVHYQPVVDLRSGRVDGVEALVRWPRGGGLVGPDVFIPAAEESGLVVAIGDHVLATVAEDAPRMAAAAGRPLSVGVNVSAHQLRSPALLPLVRRAVAAVSGGRLVLEMTEHVVIGDDEETTACLAALSASGAAIAIDDFGMGFSSIGYLQHLPVDVLKIDRSFTADVDRDERARALVEAMVLMGDALGLRVVAEGIERTGQVHRLQAAGCAVGQGFLFGRPMPLDALLGLLADHADAVPEAMSRPA